MIVCEIVGNGLQQNCNSTYAALVCVAAAMVRKVAMETRDINMGREAMGQHYAYAVCLAWHSVCVCMCAGVTALY